MYDTILVGTDGSDPANRAVEHALLLAEQYDAAVHAIAVVDTSRYGEPALSSAELVLEELEDRSNELLRDIAERADNRDLDVTTRTCHGDPHSEIIDYADDIDADLTIIGSQGASETVHHIGSVASRVVRGTDRAVLLA